MKLRHHKAFSLLEVMLTAAIISTVVIFIFRSFVSSLNSVRFGQNMILAAFLAQEKLSLIERRALADSSGLDTMENMQFKWSYDLAETDISGLYKVDFSVSWKEKTRQEDYAMNMMTYMYFKNASS